jgi:hypothetical protein
MVTTTAPTTNDSIEVRPQIETEQSASSLSLADLGTQIQNLAANLNSPVDQLCLVILKEIPAEIVEHGIMQLINQTIQTEVDDLRTRRTSELLGGLSALTSPDPLTPNQKSSKATKAVNRPNQPTPKSRFASFISRRGPLEVNLNRFLNAQPYSPDKRQQILKQIAALHPTQINTKLHAEQAVRVIIETVSGSDRPSIIAAANQLITDGD